MSKHKLGKLFFYGVGRRNAGANTNFIYMLSDILFGFLAYLIATFVNYIFLHENDIFSSAVAICLAFIIVYIISSKESRAYNVTTFFYKDRFFWIITRAYCISLIVNVLLPYLTQDKKIFENAFQLFFFLVIYYVFLLLSALLNRYLNTKTNFMSLKTILIGNKEDYNKFISFLKKGSSNPNIIGFISLNKEQEKDENYLGNINQLEEIIQNYHIDQVFIMSKYEKDINTVQEIMDTCRVMGVTTRVILNVYKSSSVQRYVSSVGTYPVMTYHAVTLNASTIILKRTIDIIFSFILLVLSSPIILVTAIAIKLDSKGPVFFKQERVGKNGKTFNMYKLRSMVVDAEDRKKDLEDKNKMKNNLMFKINDDPRVTKVGRFIRKTSIDELPQLYNVLKGDMSLVGTRPPTIDEVHHYNSRHWKRLVIWPGITGNWQVNGRSKITDFEKVVELDIEYIDNWSPLLDLKILAKTLWVVIKKEDAY